MIKQRMAQPRQRVAQLLRARIVAGEWVAGALLPSTRELAEEYHFAVNTVHAGLRILAAEGLIVLRDRKGATVAIPQPSSAGRLERLANSSAGVMFRPSEVPEILRAELVDDAPPDALAAFGLPEGVEVGLREYVVRVAGAVVTYGQSYVHPAVWEQVAELRVPEPIRDGIIGAVHRVLGKRASAVPGQRWADYAQPEEAPRLGVAEESPVLVELTSCMTGDGEIVEWNLQVHPARHRVGA